MPKYKYILITTYGLLLTSSYSFVGTQIFGFSILSLPAANSLQGDYCDVYLTHDSMSVRKAHNNGRNHLRNVQAYYERMNPPDRRKSAFADRQRRDI